MDGDSNRRVGTLIRQARQTRRLSLRGLGELCGVSVATLSAVERGTRNVTLPLVDRILAVMEVELHVETQPMWESIDVAIAAAVGRSLEERMAGWTFEFTSFVSWFAEVPYLVDGLLAAALQGAPVPVTCFEIAVPRGEERLDRLTALLDEMRARRWSLNWLQFGGLTANDPREAEEDARHMAGGAARTALTYRCIHGEFRLRLVDELVPKLWADIDRLPSDGVPPTSFRRSVPVLSQVRLPLVPLADIQVTDGYARRVLDRMRVAARPP
jgi:transcriptional regulator with XRE-family HTH domain